MGLGRRLEAPLLNLERVWAERRSGEHSPQGQLAEAGVRDVTDQVGFGIQQYPVVAEGTFAWLLRCCRLVRDDETLAETPEVWRYGLPVPHTRGIMCQPFHDTLKPQVRAGRSVVGGPGVVRGRDAGFPP